MFNKKMTQNEIKIALNEINKMLNFNIEQCDKYIDELYEMYTKNEIILNDENEHYMYLLIDKYNVIMNEM